MKITTGFGYFIKDGLRVSKYELPPGEHPDLPLGMSFVEVADKSSLDMVSLDKTAEQVQVDKETENQLKKRQGVIDKLKSLGFSDEEISVFVLR